MVQVVVLDDVAVPGGKRAQRECGVLNAACWLTRYVGDGVVLRRMFGSGRGE
jgi:hypothetical protein